MELKRTGKLLALLLAVVMVVSLLPAAALADGSGTYECADVTLETDTGKTIDDVPVYVISLSKGYDGLLFQACDAKYKRVRIVSGSESVLADLATNNEITRDSDLFTRSASDFAALTPSPVETKANYDYLVFLAEDSGFDPPPMGAGPWSKSIAYVVVEWEKEDSGNDPTDTFEIDIAAENTKLGEDNYGDSVYLITAPEGTTQVKFVCSSDNEISAIHDFYYTTAITTQPIDLADEYIVTIEGLNANCGGYGFEDIYAELPEGIYYGFSIDDREGTYPYFLISIEEETTTGTVFEIDIAAENEQVGEDNYGDVVYLIIAPEGTTQVKFVCSSDNEISAIHDFYYTTAITTQPIDLADEYIVTIEGLNANCGGYGFEDIYAELPEGIYYGFSIDDREGTYPYFLISIEGETTPTTQADKSALNAEIAQVTGDNAANYYQSGDRYNGNPDDTITDKNSGFWAELTAEGGPLERAETVAANANATQAQVDAAATALSVAIAKLIPATQLNATALYEAATSNYGWFNHEAIVNGSPAVTKRNTTAASWTAFQNALIAANHELDLLFDDEGNATAYNNSTTGDAAQNVEAALTNLQVAVSGLDELAVDMALSGISPELETAKLAYDGLDKLVYKLYHPDMLTQNRYTSESWTAYQEARSEAIQFLNTHSRPDDTAGYRECLSYVDAYRAFWSACYEGLTSSAAQVSIDLSITDNYDLLAGNAVSPYVGTWNLKLNTENATVEGALNAALGASYSFYNTDMHFQLGVYLNGIYLFNMISTSADTSITSREYSNVRLQDGDTLVVAMMYAPTESFGVTGQARAVSAKDLLSEVQYEHIRFTADGEDIRTAEGTAGQPITLNVRYMLAHPMEYNGRITSKAGAHIYISEAYATEAEARSAGAAEDTGVVTGSDGSFALTLYSASGKSDGWYVVSIVGDGKNGGLLNGANLLIHVTDDADLSALKASAKAALAELRAAYEDGFYTTEQLAEIQRLYDEAVASIDTATDSGTINSAREGVEEKIREIQKQNTDNAERSLASLAEILAMLPSHDELQASLIYQPDSLLLELLFGNNGLYSSRMTPYQKQQLSMADVALLSELETIYGEIQAGTRTLEARPGFKVKLKVVDSSTGEEISYGVFLSPSYHSFSNIQITDDNEFSFDAVDANTFGDQITEFTLPTSGLYWFHPNCYLTDQIGYQLDYLDFGVDSRYLTGNGNQLYALRSDTEITMYVVPAGSEDSSAAYLETLKAAYEGYSRSDYTTENWAALLNAYDTGKANIVAATGNEAKQAALDAALTAMAAVTKKTSASGDDIVSVDGNFNAGRMVGTVDLTVENNTYPDGAFTGVFISKSTYPIGENDTMMTVILRALAEDGYSWSGTGGSNYGIGYLSSISKDGQSLGEFSGEPGSGWMGSLNDFLVNEGFPGFAVANGQLSDGDVVRVMFTQNLGEDLGGRWGDNNTTLSSLTTSTGSFVPAFTSGTAGADYDFALLISGSSATVRLTPTAANKNYLVKTFLNEKVTYNNEGNSFYKRTEYIPVKPGDVIYVGVGEKAWPSMNKQGAEASSYSGTWYALHVITTDSGADYVNELIAKLPAGNKITLSNYKNVLEQIAIIDQVKAVLSSSEQAKVNATTLEAARERAESFKAVDEVKALLAALPKSSNLSDSEVIAARRQIEAADAAYKALTDEQKGYITVGDAENYNKLVERLSELTPDTPAEPISGSTTNPDEKEMPFEDVPEDAYYAEAVAWAVENGITDGVTETEFKPESTCNRGQIVTFLWRAAGSPKPTSTNNPFEDVKETDYFYEAVLWAVENGITDGVDATHFAPARPCTREQAVTFMWRAAGSEQVSGGEPFADVDAGDYSAAAVAWAVANEITDGVSETRFAPENECTRGQIVTFLYREYGEE